MITQIRGGNKNHVKISVASPPIKSATHSSQLIEKREVVLSNVPINIHSKMNATQALKIAIQITLRMLGSLSCAKPLENALIISWGFLENFLQASVC